MNGKILLAGALCALVSSCGAPAPKEQGPRPVKLATVASLDAIDKSFSGVVSPDQFSDLAFKMSGPLISLPIEEGQSVRRGQVIAAIDPLDYRLEYDARKASYLTAKSQMERAEKLLAKQAISRQDYETTQASYSNAKSSYEHAENTLSETKLVAPFDGFIQKKYVENYQKVQAGQGIVCLINPSKLLVEFTLPENNLADLIAKPEIYVEFDNYKGKLFKARVKEYVEASPDGSGVPVSLYIDDPQFDPKEYRVAVGFSCRVLLNIPQKSTSGATSVPLSAVFSVPTSDSLFVFVYDTAGSTLHKRAVTQQGLIGKDQVIISGGLQPGERVVMAGTTRLVDGQAVKVLTE